MLGGSLLLRPALGGGRRPEQNLAQPGSVADLQSQLDAARRELAHVREQRDILKKTLAILAELPTNVLNGSRR
jgi:hypothetical protein